MTQLIGLVDVDGVTAAFDKRAMEVCEENGIELDIDHIDQATFRYLTDHVPDKKQRNKLRRIIDTTHFFADLDLIPGAQEGVAALCEHFEVWFVSKPLDANEHCASDKMAWVKRHFPKLQDRLILAGDKSLVVGDVLIDDAPKLKWLARAQWAPVVYTQPFNSHPGSDLYDFPHFQWGDPLDQIIEIATEKRASRG